MKNIHEQYCIEFSKDSWIVNCACACVVELVGQLLDWIALYIKLRSLCMITLMQSLWKERYNLVHNVSVKKKKKKKRKRKQTF